MPVDLSSQNRGEVDLLSPSPIMPERRTRPLARLDAKALNTPSPALPAPMQTPIRELPRTDLPRASVYATGVACGVLAAIAVQILLSRAGIELSGVWRNLLSAQALQLRSAGAWWLMAGSAFLASALVVAALSRLPLPWHSFRLLRWIMEEQWCSLAEVRSSRRRRQCARCRRTWR